MDAGDVDVRLERVTKQFNEIKAVDDLDLDIQRGEFFSMLGPSGCGKTTTLRMIGGFEEPSAGTVYLGGQDVTGLPPYKRDVNTVFQSYALFPHLDVYENVAFGLRRKKVEKGAIDDRVIETLALVDLPGFEKRKPSQLSGGQQQRVALARALVNHPQVLLLDEPLGALDLKLRKQMQLELKRIQSEVGITFIYVTHDQEEAMTMSDRLAVMRHGKIEQIGAPEDVYEDPQTEFVAGFLGASNLLDGEVKDRAGDMATLLLEGGNAIRVPVERVNGTERMVKAGVRPEKIRVEPDDGEPEAAGTPSPGTLRVATFIGVSHQYTVDLPTGRTMTAFEQNLGQREPTAGRRPRATGVAARAHVRRRAVRAARGLGGGDMTQRPGADRSTPRCGEGSRRAGSHGGRCSGTRAWAPGALGLAAFLAACGTKGALPRGGPSGQGLPNAGIGTNAWWDKQTLNHKLEFANWPYYIDVQPREAPVDRGVHQEDRHQGRLPRGHPGQQRSSTRRISPSLQGGQPTGYDIIVMTNNSPPLCYLFEAGWLIPLDHRKMPNFNQYAGPAGEGPRRGTRATSTRWRGSRATPCIGVQHRRDQGGHHLGLGACSTPSTRATSA